MNVLPMRTAASAGENGPRPPNFADASVATSVSRSYQPASISRAAAPIVGRGPPGGDHLLEHADVARLEVVFEEVACPLVATPQGDILGVHRALAGQASTVLRLEQGEHHSALGPEVVVHLRQRHAGLLGHLARREPGVAVGEEPGASGGEDQL